MFGEVPASIEKAASKNTSFVAHLAAARSINLKAGVAARVRRSSLFVMDKVERTKAFVRTKGATASAEGDAEQDEKQTPSPDSRSVPQDPPTTTVSEMEMTNVRESKAGDDDEGKATEIDEGENAASPFHDDEQEVDHSRTFRSPDFYSKETKDLLLHNPQFCKLQKDVRLKSCMFTLSTPACLKHIATSRRRPA